jgi:hypothetical protein
MVRLAAEAGLSLPLELGEEGHDEMAGAIQSLHLSLAPATLRQGIAFDWAIRDGQPEGIALTLIPP